MTEKKGKTTVDIEAALSSSLGIPLRKDTMMGYTGLNQWTATSRQRKPDGVNPDNC